MISAILIGIGIGAIVSTLYNYKKKTHQGLVPTKIMLVIGIICLIIGLFMELA